MPHYFSGMFKWQTGRVRHGIIALFFLLAYSISMVSPYIPTVSAAGTITSGNHQGENSDGTWTSGNTTLYKEGDKVRFRYTLTSSDVATGTMSIVFSDAASGCKQFFTSYFEKPSVSPSGIATVEKINEPFSVPSGGNTDWNQLLDIKFSSAGSVTVIYTLQYSFTAGDCNGSSTHTELGKPSNSGDYASTGKETIPLSGSGILYAPSLTINKNVVGGEAKASDFTFTVSPQVNGHSEFEIEPDKQSVTIPDIDTDGTYTITENTDKPGYIMTAGSGDSCQVSSLANGTMFATVAAGKPATDAVCTFTNTYQSGSVTVKKDVVNDDGGNAVAGDFTLLLNDKPVVNGSPQTLQAGVQYSVSEATPISGYQQTGIKCVTQTGELLSNPFTLLNQQAVTCTITNDDVPPELTVVKKIKNDNGGTAVVSNFKLKINNTELSFGQGVTESSTTTYVATPTVVANTSYDLTEQSVSGYLNGTWQCTDNTTNEAVTVPLTLALAQKVTCTITNDDIVPVLNLQKKITNSYGGTSQPDDWTLTATGSTTISGKGTASSTSAFIAGTYDLSESGLEEGYVAGSWSCSGGGQMIDADTLKINIGDTVKCEITNSDLPASIFGTKYIVNADKTLATDQTDASGWIIQLFYKDNQGMFNQVDETTTDPNYSFESLVAGTYRLVETLKTEFTQIFGDVWEVTLGIGDSVGDFTSVGDYDFGNFKNGTISGYKWNDVNGNGLDDLNSEPKLSNWDIYLDLNHNNIQDNTDPSVKTNDAGTYQFSNVVPGDYKVCEVQKTGWIQTYPALNACHSVSVSESGDAVVGKNFGNQGRGSITLTKNLIPTSDVGRFNLLLGDTIKAANITNGGSTGKVSVAAGSYEISETAYSKDTVLSYYTTNWTCESASAELGGSGTTINLNVMAGQEWNCTFTNTRKTSSVNVIKEVINNDGGTLNADDFSVHINGGTAYQFTAQEDEEQGEHTFTTLPVGSNFTIHEIEEDSKGYATKYEGDCSGIVSETQKVCTITNDDVTPTLTVKKIVDNSGTNLSSESSDFTLKIEGTDVSSAEFAGSEKGVAVTLDAGEYMVSESEDEAYQVTFSGNCDSTGSGSIGLGEAQECVVTNTAIQKPKIEIEKSADKSVAHRGDSILYTFLVTNSGNAPLSGLTIVDDVLGTIYEENSEELNQGDENEDGLLNPGEEWVFTKAHIVGDDSSDPLINIVDACGTSLNQTTVCDQSSHTLDVLNPALSVSKAGPENILLGGFAEYIFRVTNTGDTPLKIITILDNIAGIGIYQSGDSNSNNLLDSGEVWMFKASKLMNTVGNIVNTVEVCATDQLHIDGESICASDVHVTNVYAPQVLAATSSPPPPAVLHQTGTGTWLQTLLALIMTLSAVIVLVARSKKDDFPPRQVYMYSTFGRVR